MNARAMILLLVSSVGIFFISTIRDGHDWGGDFAMYIHHAKNIVENRNYADVGYIFNPDDPFLSPKAYPPVFPLLLAPVYRLFGLNLRPMKVYVVLFFLLALTAIHNIFKDKLNPEHALALVAIMGFNPWFWWFKDSILSDLPFLLFLFLALMAYEKARRETCHPVRSYAYFVGVGITIYISYGTRIPGFLLLPSVVLHRIIQGNGKKYTTYVPVVVFAILFLIQNHIIDAIESSYTAQLLSVAPVQIFSNMLFYIKSMRGLWSNSLSFHLGIAVFLWVSVLSLVGFFQQVREEISIYVIFSILYFCLIIVWPSREGLRFLVPLIPLYLFCFLKGFAIIADKLPLYLSRPIFLAFLLLVSGMYIRTYMAADFGPLSQGISKKESVEMFDFVSDNTNPDSVIVFKKPRVLALFTGRKSSRYPREEPSDSKELWSYFSKIGAAYLITSEDDDPKYFRLYVLQNQERFERVFSNSDFAVYKIKM